MKQLELTDEQKDKLLEMCKILFPEYNNIYWNSGKGSNGSSEHIGFGTKKKDGFINYSYIHWFEFCMLHLVEAIQNKLPKDKVWREQPPYVGNVYNWIKGSKWTMYTEFFFHYPKNIHINHPVDYLYEQFKELK